MIKRDKDISEFYDILNRKLFSDSLIILKSDEKKNVIVSASFEEIIGDYCRNILKCEVISNNTKNNTIDINFDYKVNALIKKYGKNISVVKAYGNSRGDFPLLKLAKYSFFRKKNGKINRWINPE